jgi:transcriptional antiterminator NusG
MSANEARTALDIATGNGVEGEASASPDVVGEELEATALAVAPEEETAAEALGSAETGAAPADDDAQDGEVDAEAEADDQPDEPQDDRAWYVIHCYSGYESKVRHNLEQRIDTMQMQDQIFQVVVPTEDEIEVRDGKRRVVERRVFPGYILVQMTLSDDSWYVVRNTPGVTGFVGMGNEPTPLRPEEVQAILKRMEAEAPRIKVTFRPGQKVRIIDGPFNEFIGVVSEIDMERAKVRVMVSFFGRETPVELDFLQVEKA